MASFEPNSASLFALLKNDHLDLTRLMEEVRFSNDENNEKLMWRLYDDLMRHMRIEELYFYSELEGKGATHELVRVALMQHKEVKEVLQDVFPLDVRTEEWLEQIQKLQELYEVHVEEEEQEVFPQAKNFLSPEDLDRMLHDIMAESTTAAVSPSQRKTRGPRPSRIQV